MKVPIINGSPGKTISTATIARVFGEADSANSANVSTYGGRLPVDAIERFKQLKAGSTPAVLIVLWSSRPEELDHFLELSGWAIAPELVGESAKQGVELYAAAIKSS